MMDRDVHLNQSEHGHASNQPGLQTSTTKDTCTPTTPIPPPLTPNPMLLDPPTPSMTPTTSSPPPPLTPAPSISTTHVSKPTAAATAPLPHILVPAPPKLTSTATFRMYSRPILPSPSGVSKTSTPTSTTLPPPSPSSHIVAITTSTLPGLSSTLLSSNTTSTKKTSTTPTNVTTRPIPTLSSTPIKPFHTPASPPSRQVLPAGASGAPRANQSPSPVRHRGSPQTLLLGKGLRGSGQDQVLLKAQMLILTSAMRPVSTSSSSSTSPPPSNTASTQLQSVTLRPPPPGTLHAPPSLLIKQPPSSAPPPPSRPQTPFFPPLRPRPQPCAVTTGSPATPSRHLSVPPPTLYSPVRAVPLRPRLHPPNGQKAPSSRQPSIFQPITTAPDSQAPTTSTPLSGMKRCLLGPSLSQPSSRSDSSFLERSPSAARQLQIIALSSNRQPQPYALATQASPSGAELYEASKRRSSNNEGLPLSLNPTLPKITSPLASPTSLLSLASPSDHMSQRGDVKDGAEREVKVESDDQRERDRREGVFISQKEDHMETSEEGQEAATDQNQNFPHYQSPILTPDTIKEPKPILGLISAPVQNPVPVLVPVQNPARAPVQVQNPVPVLVPVQNFVRAPVPVQKPVPVLVRVQNPVRAPVQVRNPVPVPDLVRHLVQVPDLVRHPVQIPDPVTNPVPDPDPVTNPIPEVFVQRLPGSHRDLQPVHHEDLCENMSDNQSALSSLSSQSPPSSPFIIPSAENPPPLLPAQASHPPHQSQSQHEREKGYQATETEMEVLSQSEDEMESFSHWEPRAWPEGRQVLTHLVEGFVIQEGLQPFPVNRSSLLVPESVSKPQELNGTNGRALLPVTDPRKEAEHSTDSEQDEGGATDEPGARSAHRDRTVLHCQFCGKRGHAHNFMRSKRFCSTSCARGFNVRLTKRLRALSAGGRSERPRPTLNRAESVPGKPLLLRLSRDLWSAGRRESEGKEKAAAADDEEVEDMEDGGEEEEEEPPVTMTARMELQAARRSRTVSEPALAASIPTTTFKHIPAQWSVEEVTAFIHKLPGCGDVAEAFRLQEIDGQALLLLTEDHLMTSMNIKLGPALKICAHINALKNQ